MRKFSFNAQLRIRSLTLVNSMVTLIVADYLGFITK
jgi:hypothetical protein